MSLISILKRKKEELAFESDGRNIKRTKLIEHNVPKQQRNQTKAVQYEIIVSKSCVPDIKTDGILCNYYHVGSVVKDRYVINQVINIMYQMWYSNFSSSTTANTATTTTTFSSSAFSMKRSNQNPSPQPRSISKFDLDHLDPSQYYVSEKIDGIRFLLLLIKLDGVPSAFMIDRYNRLYSIDVVADEIYFDGSLFDGELAWQNDAENENKYMIWWAFDTISFKGKSVLQECYSNRLSYIGQAFSNLSDYPTFSLSDKKFRSQELSEKGKIMSNHYSPELQFRPKVILMSNKIDVIWKSIHQELHLCDGLIFTPLDEPLQLGTDGKCYKWKWNHSIDLELRALLSKDEPDKRHWLTGLFYTNADYTCPYATEDARQKSLQDDKLMVNACVDGIRYFEKTLYFVLEESDILIYILQQIASQRPHMEKFKCIVECHAKFVDDERVVCSVKMIRMDKAYPNNRYTIEQTLLNIKEALSYEYVKAALTKTT